MLFGDKNLKIVWLIEILICSMLTNCFLQKRIPIIFERAMHKMNLILYLWLRCNWFACRMSWITKSLSRPYIARFHHSNGASGWIMESCIVWITIACFGMPVLSGYDVLGATQANNSRQKGHPPRILLGPPRDIATLSIWYRKHDSFNEFSNNDSHI